MDSVTLKKENQTRWIRNPSHLFSFLSFGIRVLSFSRCACGVVSSQCQLAISHAMQHSIRNDPPVLTYLFDKGLVTQVKGMNPLFRQSWTTLTRKKKRSKKAKTTEKCNWIVRFFEKCWAYFKNEGL